MRKHSWGSGVYRWVGKRIGLALLVGVFGGCSEHASVEASVIEWGEHGSELNSRRNPKGLQYFEVSWDNTECGGSPSCGGFTVRAANREEMRCADGTFSASCYVARLRYAGPWPTAQIHLAQGHLEEVEWPAHGTVAVFIADAIWAAEPTYTPPGAAWFRVTAARGSCQGARCPVVRVARLNTPFLRPVLELDWGTTSPEQRVAAEQALRSGELIVAGEVKGGRFVAEKITVSRVYLPAPTTRSCSLSDACAPGNWCRETAVGGTECVPWVPLGGVCHWSDTPWEVERCEQGVGSCDVPDRDPMGPGVCRLACRGSCPLGEYCAPGGCRPNGSCEYAGDCTREVNAWEHEACEGFATCLNPGNFGQCAWQCGHPACLDTGGLDLGPCDEFVGYGVAAGSCRALIGCAGPGVYETPVFETLEQCEAQCNLASDP